MTTVDLVDFPLQRGAPPVDNALVTTGLVPLCVGSAEAFVLKARLDGVPWDLTGGSASLLLTDPAAGSHTVAATITGGVARASWTVQDPTGTWLRAWDVTDASSRRQVSRPIAFVVQDSPS
jgi:hypothetical protein